MGEERIRLIHGDCLERLTELPDDSVHSIVTDPPYGLSFMGKKWDYDVPSMKVWEQCLRVLKPGGHLLAFAGTRTQHRMAVNIEDAGFEIRDMIAWVYGSGFPKSLDVSKAIDKAAGAEREVVGANPNHRAISGVTYNGVYDGKNTGAKNITAPATPAAKQWDGWGSALKPAHEPVVLARKPLGEKTLAANVLKHGTGGLNIDGCRVESDESTARPSGVNSTCYGEDNRKGMVRGGSGLGRFPANVMHDGSDEVVELFPGAGEKSAARFFYCAKASKADRDEGLEAFAEQERAFFQTGNGTSGKPSSIGHYVTQRNIHPTVKPTDLMAYLIRLITPPGGVVLDPFAGSGSTGKAAIREGFKFIGIEREAEYIAITRARIEAAHV